jgi:hypothetical protein
VCVCVCVCVMRRLSLTWLTRWCCECFAVVASRGSEHCSAPQRVVPRGRVQQRPTARSARVLRGERALVDVASSVTARD